ncbi:MAG: UvrD-helicase domain-containing protein, partial [Bacteroidia bacterium]|nr:UvrD-helicase domain-containing protein [Bacteroidia bacterium]
MSQAKFLVYKSSAGSGKTFTLVKEYLKLALSDPKRIEYNFKAILALTFTNKAAAEMRTRIVAALKSISESNENSILQQRLENELKVDKTELEERSQILLQCILHHYSDFGVSTIDSFSHRIIKTFAHDLELPVNFNLETDTDEFYDRVIAKLLNEIGKNDEVTSLLKEYVLNN